MNDFITTEQAKNAFRIAKENLENNLNLLNFINIFPVADKDTGNNMSLSMSRCFAKIGTQETTNLVFLDASKTLVLVGMGNSGTILSLFFSGIADYINENNLSEMSIFDFAKAFKNGADKIEHGLSNPIEGTIYSVARDTAKYGLENVGHFSDVEGFMGFLANTAYNLLPKTAEDNPKLKEYHVIDSGALGFCMILDGFAAGFAGKDRVSREYRVEIGQQIDAAQSESGYKYCTEFVTTKPAGGAQMLQEHLSLIGDCIIPVESDGKLKIHVHTNKPEAALFIGALCGELQMTKIDDMQEDAGPIKVFFVHDDFSQRCIESMGHANVFAVENNGLSGLERFVEGLHDKELRRVVLLSTVEDLGCVEDKIARIRFYESDETLINKLFAE